MSKDPAFLFYSADFQIGTEDMTDEQVGKYIRLLCRQHLKGAISETHMLKICKTYDEDILSKFKKNTNGEYYNERLDEEIKRRKKYSQSRSNNRKSKKNKEKERISYEKDMKNICNSYEKHMENENENENKDKIIDIFCDTRIEKVFDIYKEKCTQLLPLGFARRDAAVRQLVCDFLEMIKFDFQYFSEVCTKANDLKVIANNKIDLKMILKNHDGIFNGKYLSTSQEEDISSLEFA